MNSHIYKILFFTVQLSSGLMPDCVKAQNVSRIGRLLSQETSISKTTVVYKGKNRKARIVSVKSVFDHNLSDFFKQEMKIANTLKITRPMARIRMIEGKDHEMWQEGFTYKMKILSFGVLPIGGIHEILIEELNRENTYIQTREKNNIARIWDHRLVFDIVGDGRCSYEDNVTIYAGWMTPIFARYLISFYKMRHRNWNKLLNQTN